MEEFELIAALRERLRLPEGALGWRDDAALIDRPVNVATTDMLVAGVHFELRWSSPADAGWKAAAANLSDLAAMGAAPVGMLWAVGAPKGESGLVLEAAEGLGECAHRYGAPVYGGDTVDAPVLVMAVTALGRSERLVRRDGAAAGDFVGVTGPVGLGAAGLALLRGLEVHIERDVGERLLTRHRRPEPRLAESAALAAAGATAMVDVSDGLGADLGHVAEASRVAIHLHQVPLGAGVAEVGETLGQPPARFALAGGDDYELAFTFPPQRREEVEALGFPVIGQVESGEGVWWGGERVDGLGWRHGRR